MKLDRMLAVSRKVLRSLKHDRRTAGFLVIMPLFMITIFGYTFGGSIENIEVYVVNLDQGSPNGSIADDIVSDLQTRDVLKMTEVFGPEDVALDPVNLSLGKVRDADIWAAIVFDADFSEDVLSALATLNSGGAAPPGVIRIIVDATNPNVAQAVLTELQISTQKILVGDYHLVPPIMLDEERVYGEDAEFIDFFAPGVMGLAGMMVTFILSIISFVHERSTGTLDRLLTTPATEGEIVGGYAIALGLVALGQSTILLSAAILMFDVHIEGSALLALAIIFLLGIGSQGMGFVLSSIAKNEFQAIQFLPLILFPSILLAGVFWPLEAVPWILRPVSYFIPLTYAVDGCRSVMLRGWGIGDVWPQVLVLILFAAAMLLLSALILKRRR